MNNQENNNDLESRLANLEKFYQSQLDELCESNSKIRREIKEIEGQIENRVLEEELIDTVVEEVIEVMYEEDLID